VGLKKEEESIALYGREGVSAESFDMGWKGRQSLGCTFKTLNEERSKLFLQSADQSQAFYSKWFL
jgi:hypothetical protein